MEEARDFRKMTGQDVGTTHVDKLRYVFMTEAGAKNNLGFIEAMFDGGATAIEIEVFDKTGKRYQISNRAQLADPELAWLERGRQHAPADDARAR